MSLVWFLYHNSIASFSVRIEAAETVKATTLAGQLLMTVNSIHYRFRKGHCFYTWLAIGRDIEGSYLSHVQHLHTIVQQIKC